MYKENLHERIKIARTEAGFSQQQIADELSVSQSRIAKIESGRQEPDIETLGKLAEFYSVSVDWLLGLAPKRPGSEKLKQ
ncbi:helix-turn-helix domain-containing protein [Ruminococcaceae bacterium OttesenSCG-928-L11]|nr:helix-turn-helix domain-containing protein [Ruminococcaceae bacterium OttesenSCG-928-L11]